MVKLKRIFTYLFLFVIVACGVLAGCKDKYADLKVVSDKQEQGVTLYFGEQDSQDTADIVFTVEGAGDKVSTNLKFSFEQHEEAKVVDIVNKYKDGATTIVTVKAVAGGETTLVALTEEGNKVCRVNINSIVRAKSMELNSAYKGVVVAGGEPLILNTAQIIKFNPTNTTENKIEYSLKNPVAGVEVSKNGLLTVAESVTDNYVTVVAKNILRNDLPDVEFNVKVVEHISDEKVSIKSAGEVVDSINLVANFETECTKSIDVDVVTDEDFEIEFNLVNKDNINDHNITFVSFLSKQGTNAVVYARNSGECVLKIDIVVSGIVAKSILLPVNSVELAKQILVNGNQEGFDQNIYTTYSNNLGEQFKVEVGNAFSQDRTYFILINAEDADKIAIYNADKTEINARVKTGENYSENFDILQNDTSFYVLGKMPNTDCTITIVATSTFEYNNPTVLHIRLSTLLGAESIAVTYPNEEVSHKTIFVEVGNTVTIDYTVTQQNASIIGLDLVALDQTAIDNDFSYTIENGVISITGLKANKVSAKLTLPNLVETEIFVIQIFKTITEVYASVESPLTSNVIAKVDYSFNQLSSFVMALGGTTQINFNYVGTMYDLTCLVEDNSIAVVSKEGNIYTKQVGKTTINVQVTTFSTNGNGVKLELITFAIDLTVYVPVKSIRLSNTYETLYYFQALNQTLYNQNKHLTNLSLSLFPNNVLVEDENLKITWTSSNPSLLITEDVNNLERTYIATTGDNNLEYLDSTREYIEVVVSYYGTTLTARCVVDIINPIRAQGIIVTADGKATDEIYFDSRKGLSVYNGEINANGVRPIQITGKVYPENTADKTVIIDGYDKSVVYVSPDGKVYPVGVGTTQITVYAQDSILYHGIGKLFDEKIITVTVADGQTKQTAFQINDEETLLSIKTDIKNGNNFYYYFANDVYLTHKISSFGEFAGHIDGRNHNIYNLKFANANNQYIFDSISGSIANLNLSADIDTIIDADAIISVLTKQNDGIIDGVAVTFSNFNIDNQNSNSKLTISGLVATNNGTIKNSYVFADVLIKGVDCNAITIGMIASVNNGRMYGNNNNYFYNNGSSQNFDVEGSITTEISSTTSYVGGIVGINNNIVGSNNNASNLGRSFATNIVINTPNLSYIGGIAGKNIGEIANTLVYGNLHGKMVVGGIVGLNKTENITDENGDEITKTGSVVTSIVELYKDPFEDIYYNIAGVNCIGGLVAELSGGYISNSYVYAYGEKSAVISEIMAGGLVGYAADAVIEMSSANVTVKGKNVNGTVDTIIGGLVGQTGNNVNIVNCYTRGAFEDYNISGKIVGTMRGDLSISNCYSTIDDKYIVTNVSSTSYFVGQIDSGTLSISSSYHLSNGQTANDSLASDVTNGITKTSSELTNLATYQDWDISDKKNDNSYWYISGNNNDGYPVIKYGSYLQYKTTPTQIYVNINENIVADNKIVILEAGKTYKLIDLFTLNTDVDGSNSTILVASNKSNILSGNTFGSATTISSKSEQIVKLTFMLFANTSVQTTVDVLFTKALHHYEFTKSEITLKVNESEKINGFIYDIDGLIVEDDNYYFGAEWSNSYNDLVSVSNSIQKTINTVNYIFFKNGSVLTAKTTSSEQINLNVNLYKNIGDRFVNVFGDKETSKAVTLKIELLKGATNIDVDKKSISITVLNSILLNVVVDTDNKDEILYLQNQYVELIGFDIEGYKPTGNEIFNMIMLSSTFNEELQTKTFVLELEFKDEYKNLIKDFANSIDTILSFVVKDKNGSLQHSIDIPLKAKPQNLLKIDIMHFPAGKQTTTANGNSGLNIKYNPTEIPSNTLVPGQIGLLAIDLYPGYAFFDELQITTSKDSTGNLINFIQVAYKSENNSATYVELKPNAEIIENGIVLNKQSNFANGTLTFDGKIYVKTLVTTNVSMQTIFKVTVSAYTYQRDANGNIIYGADGKPQTKMLSLQKTVDIIVSPNPEVKISVAKEDSYYQTVKIGDETKQYYLIAKGTSVGIDVLTKNYTSNPRPILNVSNATGITLVDNKLVANSDAGIGKTFTLQYYVTKTINGMEERYYSSVLEFYVVDYILLDVMFSNLSGNLTIANGEILPLSINLNVLGNIYNDDELIDSAQNIVDALQTNISYWTNNNSDKFDLSKINNEDKLFLTGKESGEGTLNLNFDYYYQDGTLSVAENNSSKQESLSKTFNISVVQVATLENPLPIRTIKEFYTMTAENDYILLEDLTFYADDTATINNADIQTVDAYNPFELKAKSFDGNCHTITIKGFNTKGTETDYLGLFTNIANNSIVKNVFVNYELVGDIKPSQTKQIIFGGLASQNQGVITNSIVTYKGQEGSATLNLGGEYNTVGAFVGINDGLITYSTVQGQTAFSINADNKVQINEYNNFTISSNGNLAGFVCTNSNLIANCQTRYLGLNNSTNANSNAMTAGFVCVNSGSISFSSVIGQLVEDLNIERKVDKIKALATTDSRITSLEEKGNLIVNNITSHNFAILESKCNIAGFVYRNGGDIKDTFANIPMKTQARTSGFAFDINSGSIWTSYTSCYFDGKTVDDNTAHTPFIGTNELGEVLNKSQNIKYCYYISENNYVELDSRFSQVASQLTYNDSTSIASYVGFDIAYGDNYSIWMIDNKSDHPLPMLQSNVSNYTKLENKNFQRSYAGSSEENNATVYQYYFNKPYEGSADNPYLISSSEQFLNIKQFNPDLLNKPVLASREPIYIRLINNLDFSTVDQSKIENLQKYTFVGDLDGNGLKISGLRVSGSNETSSTQFGLFKQIGDFYVVNRNSIKQPMYPTAIRSLTIEVQEFAKSTSTFAGILSGVVVNTNLKNIEINTQNITVLGNNVVGGVAGIILGYSTIYNVSSNASVESAYIGTEGGNYQLSGNPYKFDITKLSNSSLVPTEYNNYNKLSYAGGIAGVIAINDYSLEIATNVSYEQISYRTANIKLAKVSGELTLTAEKVGGLFGYVNDQAYIANSQFVVSTSNNQKLKGYYTAGGLVAENYGVLYLSKVEIDANSVDSYDKALTNATGEDLFNIESTNPVYIGGLVGINYGGFIANSFSKTNVIHYNASYAGGLIGYATNNGNFANKTDKNGNEVLDSNDQPISLYRPTKLDEVYTTGNVFAGANYTISKNSTQTLDDIVQYTAISKNIAGGLFGKFEVTQNDLRVSKDTTKYYLNYIEGVIGLNGFHKPTSYVVDTSTNDSGVTFGNIASGYTGSVVLSNGNTQQTTYGATVGAFVGEISFSGNIVYIDGNNVSLLDFISQKTIAFGVENSSYNYMFTPYAYNGSTITANNCLNAIGAEITMFAKAVNFTLDTDSYNNYSENANSKIKIATNKTVNTQQGDNENSIIMIAPNNAYLLYRSENVSGRMQKIDGDNKVVSTSTINYSNFIQDFTGIYQNWSISTWKCQSPVYPKFVEKDTTGYVLIRTEQDLQNINNNYTNYMLVEDIFLTKPFKPISTFTGNFVSATRPNGSTGIDGSEYYGIYNICLENSTSESVGIFANVERANIQNINFIFGTTIEHPLKGNPDIIWEWQDEWEDESKRTNNGITATASKDVLNVGSIAGYVIDSTINCNVYFQTGTGITVKNGECSTANIGGIVGGSENSSISGSLNFGVINVNKINSEIYTSNCQKQQTDTTIEIEDLKASIKIEDLKASNLNVGGLVGKILGSSTGGYVIESNYSNINILSSIPENINTECTANIGGLYGAIEPSSDGNSIEVTLKTSADAKYIVDVSGSYDNLNIGGVVGLSNNAIISAKDSKFSLNINALPNANNIYLGGFVGSVTNNPTTISDITIEQCKINNSATITGDAETGNLSMGGFVGDSSNLVANLININKLSINTFIAPKGLSVTNNSSIGGFVGTGTLSGEKTYVSALTIDLINAKLGSNSYIGGYAGRAEITGLKTGFAKGEIKLPMPTALGSTTCYAGGFVGQFQELNSNEKVNSSLTYCIADVKITANATSENLHLAGFANVDNTDGNNAKATLKNCVSLGDLSYDKIFTGTATGFVDYATAKVEDCYSLSTLKLVSATNSNISADYFDKSKTYTGKTSIFFNYNLSGSAYYKAQDTSFSKDYSTICKEVQKLLNNKNDSTINAKYKNGNRFILGIKINPIENPPINSCEDGKYYIFKVDYEYQNGVEQVGADLKGNIIADAPYTIGLITNIDISENAYITKLIFQSKMGGSIIKENNGYLFDCLTISEPSFIGDVDYAGFVGTNNGFINCCGTIAQINGATKENTSASGFVTTNNGIVANSFANGVIRSTQDDKGVNCGFVYQNAGTIANCYTSTTIFDRNTYDDSLFANTYVFDGPDSDGTITNCYYDKTAIGKNSSDTTKATEATHQEIINNKVSDTQIFSNVNKLNNYNTSVNLSNSTEDLNLNFGMPLTLSFTEGLTTGDTDTNTYYTKNISHFQSLMKNLSTKGPNITLNVLTNLDGKLLLDDNYINSLSVNSTVETTSITMSSNNNDIYTIYNIKLSSALLSADTITLKNIGLVVESIKDPDTTNGLHVTGTNGVFVKEAGRLEANNVYVSLKNQVVLSSVDNFGLLAGQVGTANISNCFTSGDIVINRANAGANIGHMIGEQSGNYSSIHDIFTSGIIAITSNNEANEIHVGGIIGHLSACYVDSANTNNNVLGDGYSNVLIKNYITSNTDNVYVGSVAGVASYVNKSFGTTTKLTSKSDATEKATEFTTSMKSFAEDYIYYNCYNASVLGRDPTGIQDSAGNMVYKYYNVYSASIDTSGINISNLYFDPNITLVDNYVGNIDWHNNDISVHDDLETEINESANALFNRNPFGHENSYNYTYTDLKHFPMQSVFENNTYTATIKGTIGIVDGQTTGSRMSPVALTNENYRKLSSQSSDKNVYYSYLSENITASSAQTLENIVIYGCNKNLTLQSVRYAFVNLTECIITGLNIKKAIVANITNNVIIYNCSTSGSVTNANSAFINTNAENSILKIYNGKVDDLTVTINNTSITRFGGFVDGYYEEGGIVLINPHLNLKLVANSPMTHIGGIVATGDAKQSTDIVIINPTIELFEVIYDSGETSTALELGGISAFTNYRNLQHGINQLMGKITIGKISLTRNGKQSVKDYIGLLYGHVDGTSNIVDIGTYIYPYDDPDDPKDGSEVLLELNGYAQEGYHRYNVAAGVIGKATNSSPDLSGKIYSSNLKDIKISVLGYKNVEIGGYAGFMTGISNLKNINMVSRLLVNTDIEGTSYIGGIIGKITGGAYATEFKQSGAVNVTDASSPTNCYVGGFAGYSDSTVNSSGNSTGLVAASSSAKSSATKTKIQDLRQGTIEMTIPLAVGGIYGYYKHASSNTDLSKITKTNGGVRALLTANNYLRGLGNTVIKNSGSIINESIQCRAGGFAGLVTTDKISTGVDLGISGGDNIAKALNMDKGYSSLPYEYSLEKISNGFDRTGLSYVNIFKENIFTTSVSTFVLQNKESLGRMQVRRILAIDNNYAYDNNTDFELSSEFVFAGYTYNNITYNRSYWTKLEYSSYYGNLAGTSYNNYYLYAYEHWAGQQFGATIFE